MRSKILLITILLCLPLALMAKKTTTKSRMTNACFRTYSTASSALYVTDTDVYVYSGYNTGEVVNKGTPLLNNWTFSGKYDTLTRRRYDTVAAHPPHYYLRDRTFNHYAGTNSNLDTSTFQTYDTSTAVMAYKNFNRNIYTYDASNNIKTNMTQYWVASAWKDSLSHSYTYDGSNNMLTDTFTNLGNTNNNTLTLYHYTSGTLDTQTVMNWNSGAFALTTNSRRYTYYLNASHKADSMTYLGWSTTTMSWVGFGGFPSSARHKYTYDAPGGNVIKDSLWNYFGTAWYLSSLNIYTYSGSDMISDTSKTSFGGPLTNSSYQVNTYDAGHRQLTSEKYVWLTSGGGSWRDSALYTNGYNSFGQDTVYMTQTRVGGSWVFTRVGGVSDVYNRYYYTTFIDPTDVPTVTAPTGDLKLYPVPANNSLNIDLSWQSAQTAVIAIYDMSGRLWIQWQSDNTDHYKHTVYISQLPAGNYILKANGEDDQAVQPFVIVR